MTPTTNNPLGAKGVGEAGTTGSIGAVHNAVVDALSYLGVRELQLPLSPQQVWRALQAVDQKTAIGGRDRSRALIAAETSEASAEMNLVSGRPIFGS